MTRAQDPLLAEAHRLNYRLRSTFFYRRLKEYRTLALPGILAGLLAVEHLYNWDDRAGWGIGEDAFTFIAGHPKLKLLQVFCHPKALREYPALLAYYRNIAVLSQKAVSYLIGVNVEKYETTDENPRLLPDGQSLLLARLFNEHISLIIDSSLQSLTEEELSALLFASTGAQIDGSWRNAIGDEAEKVVQRLLIKEAMERGLLSALMPRAGSAPEPYHPEEQEAQFSDVGRYRGIMLSNQTSLLFSSEPDVALIGKTGQTLGVIEIKGGADPAGALERYGAAKKSFDQVLRHTPDAATFLVASCITPEVQQRIAGDASIFAYYNLTELVSEPVRYQQFMNQLFSLLG